MKIVVMVCGMAAPIALLPDSLLPVGSETAFPTVVILHDSGSGELHAYSAPTSLPEAHREFPQLYSGKCYLICQKVMYFDKVRSIIEFDTSRTAL